MIDVHITIHIAQVNAKIIRVEINQLQAYLTALQTHAVDLEVLHATVFKGLRLLARSYQEDKKKTKQENS